MSRESLRKLPLFADLSDADLDWLDRAAEARTIPADGLLVEEGAPADAVYVILDGSFSVTKRSGEEDVVLDGSETGGLIGEIAVLENAPRTASVRALEESHVLRIGQDAFRQFLSTSPSGAVALLHTVMRRLRNTEAMLMQHEKMAALGNMAAGLAHELNNPAAAIRRTTDQLGEALAGWQRASFAVSVCGLDTERRRRFDTLSTQLPASQASLIPPLDPLARSDREGELQDWLEAVNVENAWELAPALVDAGWDRGRLAGALEGFAPSQAGAVAAWLASAGLVQGLLHELGVSAGRISEIVKAVKTYSYMDQGPVQRVDVHEGLEDTLIVLRHKLKGGVTVVREYAADLPSIEAHGGELNQVWTNIIDNAVDAMGGQGRLCLRTHAQEGAVVVEITDNGPGIPPDVQPRIFEPFFTTKGPGFGTGLGLHIARNIVVLQHGGHIRVRSRPGETTFEVTLPIELKSPGERN
jgi:signal transduction histidine kinase